MKKYSIAAPTPAAMMPVASHSGSCQFEYSGSANDGDQSAEAEPSRAIERLMPNAKPSSLPLNHLASTAVTATISGSAPRPSRKRPAISAGKFCAEALTAAATTHSAANATIARRAPNRSIT